MNERQAEDRTLRQYLLGALPAEDQARIESDALRNDGRFEELLALEDELFHEYAQGGLSDGERRLFEARFLSSPEGVLRLEAARALLERLGPPRLLPFAARHARWLAAAAALLIAAATAWLGWRTSRSPDRVREAARPTATPSPVPTSAPSVAPVRVIALALSPGLVRGAGKTPQVTLPAAGEATLRLTLLLPAARREERYAAVLQSAEGLTVWSGAATAVTADGKRVVLLEVPAGNVPEADYEVLLRALTAQGAVDVAAYPLRVLRE
jgi:hypothetical protein